MGWNFQVEVEVEDEPAAAAGCVETRRSSPGACQSFQHWLPVIKLERIVNSTGERRPTEPMVGAGCAGDRFYILSQILNRYRGLVPIDRLSHFGHPRRGCSSKKFPDRAG